MSTDLIFEVPQFHSAIRTFHSFLRKGENKQTNKQTEKQMKLIMKQQQQRFYYEKLTFLRRESIDTLQISTNLYVYGHCLLVMRHGALTSNIILRMLLCYF